MSKKTKIEIIIEVIVVLALIVLAYIGIYKLSNQTSRDKSVWLTGYEAAVSDVVEQVESNYDACTASSSVAYIAEQKVGTTTQIGIFCSQPSKSDNQII